MNNNTKITGDDLFRMVPGLKDAMTKSLEEMGIPHEEQKQPDALKEFMELSDWIIASRARRRERLRMEGLDKNE